MALKISHQDRNELSSAIDIFGLKRIVGILAKSVDEKKSSCEAIRAIFGEYDPSQSEIKPNKMLRAVTKVAVRLIKDKMWAIFTQAILLTNAIFQHFIFAYPVPKKEVGDSSVKIYKGIHKLRGPNLNNFLQFLPFFITTPNPFGPFLTPKTFNLLPNCPHSL